MIELFPNISNELREETKFWITLALLKKDPYKSAKMIEDFKKRLRAEEEKNYVDFAFQAKIEELKRNENHSN